MAIYQFWFRVFLCLSFVSLLIFLNLAPWLFPSYQHQVTTKGRVGLPNLSTDYTTEVRGESDLHATHGFSLSLAVRIAATPKLVHRLYCLFLRAATVFWSPKLGPITLIFDKESERDHQFAEKLRQQENKLGLKFDFTYEPYPETPSGWKPVGYQRQLWNSFFMDLYVNASVIGWTDTDMLLMTPVTPENIFNGNRLRVVSMNFKNRVYKQHWDKTTFKATGKVLVSDYGTYFPNYVWRDTITNCRNHMIKYMNVSHFEDAYRQLPSISPVNIIFNYAYQFEHDRYDWHLDFMESFEEYNARLPAGVSINVSETEPDVLVSVHERYYKKDPYPLLRRYCVAKRHIRPLPRIASCSEYEKGTNFQLFEYAFYKNIFQTHMVEGTWCWGNNGRRDCARRIEAHYHNVKKYYKLGWYDLDFRRITAVEEMAKQENATCPKIFKLD